MIYTSNYFNPNNAGKLRVRISKTKPKDIIVDLYAPVLEPSADILWGYKDRTVSEKEYTRRYIENLNRHENEIRTEMERIKDAAQEKGLRDIVLLCWCGKEKFCHRRLFARWWQEKTGEIINEL